MTTPELRTGWIANGKTPRARRRRDWRSQSPMVEPIKRFLVLQTIAADDGYRMSLRNRAPRWRIVIVRDLDCCRCPRSCREAMDRKLLLW